MTDELQELRHDIRTTLQVIGNAAYIIENILKKLGLTEDNLDSILKEQNLSPSPYQALRIIHSALNQATEILEDPLDIVRIQEIQFSPFIQRILRDTIVPENIQIVTQIKHEQFFFDPIKMRRIIVNLIKNAIEAMPDGGKITVLTKKQKDKEIIQIADNGPGIPPDMLPGLFLKEQTTKMNGNGIGLISCRKIVEAHRGTIKVKNKEGKGTTFTISLPITTQ